MKHKVAELEGALLDAAVAKADGWEVLASAGKGRAGLAVFDHGFVFSLGAAAVWSPSTDWTIGGPIIERERISVYEADDAWFAEVHIKPIAIFDGNGPTPLIAAMRA